MCTSQDTHLVMMQRWLRMLKSICPRQALLWEQFIWVNPSRVCSSVHLPGTCSSTQCPVTMKYASVLSACHTLQVRLTCPVMMGPMCEHQCATARHEYVHTFRWSLSRYIFCLNTWMMHAWVCFRDSREILLVAQEAMSSIVLNLGFLNAWMGWGFEGSEIGRQRNWWITYLIGMDEPLNCCHLKGLVAVWNGDLCPVKMVQKNCLLSLKATVQSSLFVLPCVFW